MNLSIAVLSLAMLFGSMRSGFAEAPITNASPAKEVIATETNSTLVVGISPFLESSTKDAVYRSLVRLIVEDIPLGAKLELYDAFNLKSITRIAIPDSKVFNSPKARANQFAVSIGEIKRFLARDNARPEGPKLDFSESVRLPQFADFLSRDRLPAHDGSASIPLLLMGSPLYQDAKEPGFSMVDGFFPSDGHLRASREQSVFGFNPGEGSARGLQVYWVYFGDPWMNDLHREKVARFWSLYLERSGGRLASFSADLATALGAFNAQIPGPSAAANGWVAEPRKTRPEMLRVSRNVEQLDWLTGSTLPEMSPSPPGRLVGPLKIGIRWKDNVDLDLYATPRRESETLFFQHPRSHDGYYFKDHRSTPGHEFEYIEFESPVDVREVRAFVNFYEGSCAGGAHGEVRLEFLNRIYRGNFTIAAAEGNEGRSGAAQGEYWTRIPILEILGIKEESATVKLEK